MALIQCPDCNTDVSARAPTCPKCGAPIAAAEETKAAGAPLTTTQSTTKKLKSHLIYAVAMMVIGGIITYANAGNNITGYSTGSIIGVVLIVAGMGWWMATKIRVWWHHG